MPKLLYRSKMPTPEDPTVWLPIVQAITKGHPLATAAAMAGIHEDTLYHWRYQGQDELAAATGWTPWDELGSHARLVIRIKEAEAGLVDEALDHVRAGGKDWPAWMTLLERRRPQDFGRRDRLDVETRSVSVTVTASLSDATAESLRELLAERAALREIEPPRGAALALPAPQPAPSPPHTPADA